MPANSVYIDMQCIPSTPYFLDFLIPQKFLDLRKLEYSLGGIVYRDIVKLISAVLIGAILVGSLGVSLLSKANQLQSDTKYASLFTGSVLSGGGNAADNSNSEFFTGYSLQYVSVDCAVRVPPVFAASLPYGADGVCYPPVCCSVSVKFSKRAPPDAFNSGIFQNTVSKLLI